MFIVCDQSSYIKLILTSILIQQLIKDPSVCHVLFQVLFLFLPNISSFPSGIHNCLPFIGSTTHCRVYLLSCLEHGWNLCHWTNANKTPSKNLIHITILIMFSIFAHMIVIWFEMLLFELTYISYTCISNKMLNMPIYGSTFLFFPNLDSNSCYWDFVWLNRQQCDQRPRLLCLLDWTKHSASMALRYHSLSVESRIEKVC